MHRDAKEKAEPIASSGDRPESADALTIEEMLEEASAESFPASDAPGWTPLTAIGIGPPAPSAGIILQLGGRSRGRGGPQHG